jgi:transposase-like protein
VGKGTTRRKSYTANFKTKPVLTLLREEKTLTELASESGVHPNQLRNWRDLVLQEMDTLFEKKEATTQMRAAHEGNAKSCLRKSGACARS